VRIIETVLPGGRLREVGVRPHGDHAGVGFITEAPGPLLPAGSGLPGILARPTQGYVETRSHPWLYPTRYGP